MISDICIAISKTWTKENYIHYDISGYSLHYVDRINKQGGGVALYIKNKFDCNKVEQISYEYENYFEIITVELKLQRQKNIIVVVHRKLISMFS